VAGEHLSLEVEGRRSDAPGMPAERQMALAGDWIPSLHGSILAVADKQMSVDIESNEASRVLVT